MKLWRFYLKPKNAKAVIPDEEVQYAYPLYAVTQSKKFAKEFKRSRNMDLFIERYTDNVDREDGETYLQANRAHLIVEGLLESIHETKTEQYPIYVRVLTTENELNYLTEATDSGEILNLFPPMIDINIFCEELQEALAVLNYDKVQNWKASSKMDQISEGIYDLGFDFNMLGCFIFLFSKYYKEGYFQTCEVYSDPPDNVDVISRR